MTDPIVPVKHQPGPGHCPDCGQAVLFAVYWNGITYSLDQDPTGQVAVAWEAGAPRSRIVGPGAQLRLDEALFSPHITSCIPPGTPLAAVHDLDRHRITRSAPSTRRTTHAR